MLAAGHHGDLGHDLAKRDAEFTSYAVSFAVIAIVWVRHHRFYGVLLAVDGWLTAFNLVYLGLVAFPAYPTRLLGLYGDEPTRRRALCGHSGGDLTLAGLARSHALREGLVSELGQRQLSQREHPAIAPGVFLLSIRSRTSTTTLAELSVAVDRAVVSDRARAGGARR